MSKDENLVKAMVELLGLAMQLGNVSQSYKLMGYSEDSV